jgi:hypothetical protein
VQGVCETRVDTDDRVTGVVLRVPYFQNIVVEEDAPEDFFDLPLRAVKNLRQLSTVQDLLRVRVRGTVLHQNPGRHVYLEDGDAGLTLLTRAEDVLRPGDRIEAVGILGWEGARTVVREAHVRRLSEGPAPTPVRIEDLNRPSNFFDSRLVTASGTVIDIWRRPDLTRLTLQHEQTLFEAVLPQASDALEQRGVAVGADLQLTGIYRIGVDDARQTRGFSLQLRSPEDVTVVRKARLWTVQRALLACGILAGCSFLGLVWAGAPPDGTDPAPAREGSGPGASAPRHRGERQ